MRSFLFHMLSFCILTLVPALVASTQEKDRPIRLDSAKVTAVRLENRRGNRIPYSPNQIKGTVSTLGEPDIIRFISGMPGVSAGMEGSLGLFVRGANTGGNKVVLDGVPLSSYSHMLGLISSISPESVSETTFRPGGISAEHGELSSSLIEISTRKATQEQPFTAMSVSPYLVSLTHSGRSKDCRSGLLVSGRASALPYLVGTGLKLLNSSDSNLDVNGFLYDLTVQGDWTIKKKSRLDVLAYTSQDYYRISNEADGFRLKWWSASLKAGWEYSISPKATLYSKLYHIQNSSYEKQVKLDAQGKVCTSICMSNAQRESNLFSSIHYTLSPELGLDGGIELAHRHFTPAQLITIIDSENGFGNKAYPSTILAGFVSLDYSIPERIHTTLGLRESASSVSGAWRSSPDIRFKSDIYVTKNFGIELTGDKFTQFHHVLEGLPVGWSLDILIPSYGNYPEEKTYQGYLGAFFNGNFASGRIDACLGGFYRQMNNLVSYKSSSNFLLMTDSSWDHEVAVGSGRSFGAELSASYTSKRANATLAYTLSRTTRHFDEINDGEEFLFRYDRPHVLNLNADILVGSRTSKKGKTVSHRLNSSLSYSSGNLVTMPMSSYKAEPFPFWDTAGSSIYLSSLSHRLTITRYEYGTKNNCRMEDYLRLDLAYSIEIQKKSKTTEWSFSVFNVLNRHNPMLIFYNGKKYQSVSLLPIMPSVRWSCRW